MKRLIGSETKRSRFFQSLLFVLSMSLIFSNSASAYFDPGTGSLILQILAAGAVSVAVFWRQVKAKIVGLFKKDKDGDVGK
jgi:hypothetical protein